MSPPKNTKKKTRFITKGDNVIVLVFFVLNSNSPTRHNYGKMFLVSAINSDSVVLKVQQCLKMSFNLILYKNYVKCSILLNCIY